MNNKEEILKKLFSLQRFGIKPGLERTLKLLNYGNNPHKKFKSIHVAGTNGKGSVSSMIASILIEAGYTVGLYTSPHLEKFNERIKINGVLISDKDLIDLAIKYLKVADKWNSTFFEITTVMAFDYFAQNNIDLAVIETGMGGRFDSTNVISPLISVITNISLEHKEYLGNTLEKIAFEKAGIIKHSTPVVVSDSDKNINKIFHDIAVLKKSDIYFSDNICSIENVNYEKNFTMKLDLRTDKYEYKNLVIGLSGNHQINNLKSVISTMEYLQDIITINTEHIYNGLRKIYSNTNLIARISLIHNFPTIILDTAHNPASVQALIETLKLSGYENKWNIIFSSLFDKDVEDVLKQLFTISNKLFLTKLKTNRAIDLEKLIILAKTIGFAAIHSDENSIKTTKKCIEYNEPTLIVGSFYLVGEILPYIKKMII